MGAPRLALELERRGVTWISRKNLARTKRISQRTVAHVIEKIEGYRAWLPPGLYAQVLEVRAARAGRQQNRRMVYPPPLLRGVLWCDCGDRYIAHTATVRGRKETEVYYYKRYKHPNPVRCGASPQYLKTSVLDEVILDRLARLERLDDDDREAVARAMVAVPTDPVLNIESERAALHTQLSRLNQEWLNIGMSNTEYIMLRRGIEQQLNALPPETKSVSAALTYPEARARVDSLFGDARKLRDIPPREANAIIHKLIKQVVIRVQEIVKIEWQLPLEGILD